MFHLKYYPMFYLRYYPMLKRPHILRELLKKTPLNRKSCLDIANKFEVRVGFVRAIVVAEKIEYTK